MLEVELRRVACKCRDNVSLRESLLDKLATYAPRCSENKEFHLLASLEVLRCRSQSAAASLLLQPLASTNHMDVEMRRSYHAPQPHPQRQEHFSSARARDVPEVNNIGGSPTEPFAEPAGDFAFGRCVIATNEQVVISR